MVELKENIKKWGYKMKVNFNNIELIISVVKEE